MPTITARRPATIATFATAALLALTTLGAAPEPGHASELVDRSTSGEVLKVNRRGVALVTYRTRGNSHHVLYWGAINASKLRFRHDRSGGWRWKLADWRTFRNTCRRYTGPPLGYLLRACTAPDGSHWVLQKWVRIKPNYGGRRGTVELRLSHFRGPQGKLWINTDWSWGGRYHHLYGQLTYRGVPWFGQKYRPDGYVLDQRGRNVAVESLDSDYGRGWRRVNAFLSHPPNGQFCFGFAPKGGSPFTGRSSVARYRASVPGPAVSPDLFLSFRGQTVPYTAALDAPHDERQRKLVNGFTGRHSCKVIN